MKDKDLALKIDRFQLSLNPTTTDVISFKPWPADACSVGNCPVSLETWLRNSEDKRNDAENEIARATRAVNDSWNLIRKSMNDIKHQREATQFALRKRRHETLQVSSFYFTKYFYERILNVALYIISFRLSTSKYFVKYILHKLS